MGKKKLSGAAKRKKKKEKEEAIKEAAADLEHLKLGPTKLWTGLVKHHKDIFVSHVMPKLNETDRYFFSEANTESLNILKYAGINVLEFRIAIEECTFISTLEWAWDNTNWGEKSETEHVIDQAWFCAQVDLSNKIELLKWAREEKKCEWNKWTIKAAALRGNLKILKYCLTNDCPFDERGTCTRAAGNGHLDCLRFLFDKVKPPRETENAAAKMVVAREGHLDILKYVVEEKKITNDVKIECLEISAMNGCLDCLKYMVEEVKVPLHDWLHVARTRYFEHPECIHYLREKGCPEPTDEEYA